MVRSRRLTPAITAAERAEVIRRRKSYIAQFVLPRSTNGSDAGRVQSIRKTRICSRSAPGFSSPSTTSSSSSPSSSFLDSDVPSPPSPPPAPPTVAVQDNGLLMWERKVTAHICYDSGVLHFPKHIGRRIPNELKELGLCLSSPNRKFVYSLRSAPRCKEEKYLSGKVWRSFVKFEGLKFGDTLKMRLREDPLCILVEIVRFKDVFY